MSNELTRAGGDNSLQFTRDPRLGIIAATLKCWAPDPGTALFAPAPAIGVPIPEWNPRQINRRESGEVGGYDVIVSYEGHPDPAAAGEESFELEGMTSEDPIETHWNYEVLLKNYRGKEDATGRAKWPRNLTDAGGKAGRNLMHGVESWACPGLIWNHNWVSRILPVSIVEQLGTLSKGVPGNPPELSGDREWFCIRVRGRNRGNVWQVQQSWQMTGPHGVAPELYQRA